MMILLPLTYRIYEIEERIVMIEDNEFRIEEVGNCISPSLKEWNILSRPQIWNCPTNINLFEYYWNQE